MMPDIEDRWQDLTYRLSYLFLSASLSVNIATRESSCTAGSSHYVTRPEAPSLRLFGERGAEETINSKK